MAACVGPVDVVMSLHSQPVYRHVLPVHLPYHSGDAVALGGIHSTVVVVEEQGIGVGLVGKDERLGDELIAAKPVVAGLAVGTGDVSRPVGNGFIDHIPGIDNVLVAVDHGMDVLAQPFVEDLLGYFPAKRVGKHPVGKLIVPAQAAIRSAPSQVYTPSRG